ncbi:MAG: hypothetical protein ACM3US_00025 [Sphingomonadaceae bacterium]
MRVLWYIVRPWVSRIVIVWLIWTVMEVFQGKPNWISLGVIGAFIALGIWGARHPDQSE